MAQVVEAETPRQPCAVEMSLERTVQVTPSYRRSHLGGEYEAVFLPEPGVLHPLLQLALAVFLQGTHASG